MRVQLVYVCDFDPDAEGVGTEYDALHVAVGMLQKAIANADSNDDLADVFTGFVVREK